MSVESPDIPDNAPLPHREDVQALRGVAALAVLFAHLFVMETKYSLDQLLGPWAQLGYAGVDLFFVISGFIMVYVTWGTARGPDAPLPFLWRRVTRIYPLYWIVSAVVLAVWLLRPEMVFQSNPDPGIVRSFLLIPQERLPLLTVGWTLIHEMYFYLVFSLFLLAPRRWMMPLIGAWCVGVSMVATFAPPSDSPWLELVFDPLLFEFVGGAVIAATLITGRVGGRLATRLFVIGVPLAILIIGNLAVRMPSGLLEVFQNHLARSAIIGSAAIFVLAAVVHGVRRVPRGMAWLGDISYSLYLTHILTISAIGRLWSPWAAQGVWDNLLMLAVMVLASVAVAGVIHHLVEAPLIAWFRRRRRPAPPPRGASAAH